MKRALAGLAIAGGVLIGAGQLASAYPPDGAEVVVSATVVAPGGTVTVTLVGCLPGETVRFTLADVTVDVTCSAGGGGDSRLIAAAPYDGAATATLRAPTAPGTYVLTAVGLTSGVTETVVITVTGGGGGADDGDDGTAGGRLPSTGSDTDTTLWVAGGALAAGVALTSVAMVRRRRPSAAG